MAADSMIVSGDCRRGYVKKITRLADGSLLGCAGNSAIIDIFVRWAESGADLKNPPKFSDKDDFGMGGYLGASRWFCYCLEQ